MYVYMHKNALIFQYCLQTSNLPLAPGPHKSYKFSLGSSLSILFE